MVTNIYDGTAYEQTAKELDTAAAHRDLAAEAMRHARYWLALAAQGDECAGKYGREALDRLRKAEAGAEALLVALRAARIELEEAGK